MQLIIRTYAGLNVSFVLFLHASLFAPTIKNIFPMPFLIGVSVIFFNVENLSNFHSQNTLSQFSFQTGIIRFRILAILTQIFSFYFKMKTTKPHI